MSGRSEQLSLRVRRSVACAKSGKGLVIAAAKGVKVVDKKEGTSLPRNLRPDVLVRVPWTCRLRIHNFVPTGQTRSFGYRAMQQDICIKCGRLRNVQIGWDLDDNEGLD